MGKFVFRTFECGMGHRWKDVVAAGSPPPDECPTCQAIVGVVEPAGPARSDTVAAPGIRGERTKAVARFEGHAFKRAHFEDGKPLLTNLRDNVREGESYAVPETPSTNETMRLTKQMLDAQRETPGGAQMMQMGGGWQGASPQILSKTAGGSPVAGMRPAVDLKSKRA